MNKPNEYTQDIPSILNRIKRPKKAVITAGMPYANGPLHLGHMAGALIPPDVLARFMRMLIGKENVLFISGNDDHGSTSEVAAMKAGRPVREFIDEIHEKHLETLNQYGVSFNVFSGTSRPECFPIHTKVCQDFIRKLYHNGMLEKRTSKQWFDPKLSRFLQDRNVTGKCPNPKCENEKAYSDECEVCGQTYNPSELLNPKSALSDGTPELRDTTHWWLDMWKVSEELRQWIGPKKGKWRNSVFNSVNETVQPSFQFDNVHEDLYKELKATLPKHKSRYAPGKKIVNQFENKEAMLEGKKIMEDKGIPCLNLDGWAKRSITRDVAWGIPLPDDLDPDMKGKTFYVWPDSLIAPLSFCQVALNAQGKDPELYKEFWTDPESRVFQFIGIDNVYFYVLMQGAMWFGTQEDIHRMPLKGETQLTDVFAVYHLLVNGEKMSKSTGNYFTGDQLIHELGYTADQIRYFLVNLSIAEKASSFDIQNLKERNKFLAGPLNASFEKPISACHSKFAGVIPEGTLNEQVVKETTQIVEKYLKHMEKAEFPILLGQIENYARIINRIFVQQKPHDDRHDETQRKDGLYTCFYVLKNLMIMLYPFAPFTMEKVRESLNLDPSVFKIDELGKAIPAGHKIGQKQQYFPAVEESEQAN